MTLINKGSFRLTFRNLISRTSLIIDFGKNKIKLSGQAYLVDFYTDLGFKKVSDVYMEDNIEHFEFLYCDGE